MTRDLCAYDTIERDARAKLYKGYEERSDMRIDYIYSLFISLVRCTKKISILNTSDFRRKRKRRLLFGGFI